MAVRLLGLGNDILGDDAFGLEVARRFRSENVEVVTSSESGLHLLDYIENCSRLIVVDTVQTGRAEPGTIYVLGESDVPPAAGDTPHCTGLFDALALARKLGMSVPAEVTIIAVEAADCLTVGGPMHPAVAAAISRAIQVITTLNSGTDGTFPGFSKTAPPTRV